MKKQFTRFFIALFVIATVFFSLGFENDTSQPAYSNAAGGTVVYLGGKPLGVEISTEGVIITGVGAVVTNEGLVTPLKYADVKCGDILLSVGGFSVRTPDDITSALNKITQNNVQIKVKRGENAFDVNVTTAIDALSGEKKLGISVRDAVSGVGTLTYIKGDKTYGALGHHISDTETGLSAELHYGKIFDCTIIGVKRAQTNRAGELVGEFNKYGKGVGNIHKNNRFGIFGEYTGDLGEFRQITTASANEIVNGKAYIYSCIEGESPDFYTIDIIKTNIQEQPGVKSMVISVTDRRLIEKTGGIVQGMSGSPIIQNGKLIGAVTHVFVGDATKGYGLYIDWMLQN